METIKKENLKTAARTFFISWAVLFIAAPLLGIAAHALVQLFMWGFGLW